MHMEYWRDELYHHGIKGQRWGIRRFQNPDGTYTPEGKLRRNNGFNSSDNMTPELASLMAVYGIIGIGMLSKYAINKGATAVRTMRSNNALKAEIKSRTGEIDDKTGLRLKTSELPLDEDVKHINPGYNENVKNSSNNCPYCAVAAEIRRRGYDVSAGRLESGKRPEEMRDKYYPSVKENQLSNMKDIRLAYNGKTISVDFDSDKAKERFVRERSAALCGTNYDGAKFAINNLTKDKNSSGVLSIKWGFGGGHMVAYRVEHGDLTIVEGQTGKIYNGSSAEEYLASGCLFASYRLDNASINYKALIDDGVIK